MVYTYPHVMRIALGDVNHPVAKFRRPLAEVIQVLVDRQPIRWKAHSLAQSSLPTACLPILLDVQQLMTAERTHIFNMIQILNGQCELT